MDDDVQEGTDDRPDDERGKDEKLIGGHVDVDRKRGALAVRGGQITWPSLKIGR